jgi:hypothetical protein
MSVYENAGPQASFDWPLFGQLVRPFCAFAADTPQVYADRIAKRGEAP